MSTACRRHRHSEGFTLLELVVTIAVAAVLLTVALPSFSGLLRTNRVTSTSNSLLAAVNLARAEALKSNRGGGICASTDGAACSPTGDDWVSGWIVWADLNNNGALDLAPVDERVRVEGRQRQLTISADEPDVVFSARGRPASTLSLQVQPTTCKAGRTDVRNIDVLASGMVRISTEDCP